MRQVFFDENWTGVKIKYLTFIKSLPKQKHKDREAIFECECGEHVVKNFYRWTYGQITTCGCGKKNAKEAWQKKHI